MLNGKTSGLENMLKVIKFLITTALKVRASQQSITPNLWSLITHIYHVMIIVTDGFSMKYLFLLLILFLFRRNFLERS